MPENAEPVYFDDATGTLLFKDVRIELRPKTYAVAKYLGERAQEVCSKEQIMDAIWENSFVEEQAVFQSINEIRRKFEPSVVIQTYPRRGYRWVLPVALHASNQFKKPEQLIKHPKSHWLLISFLVALLIGSVGVSWYTFTDGGTFREWGQNGPHFNATEHQALMVLPTDTSALTSKDRGLGFGALQSVLERFPTENNRTIFQATDVLDIMDRKQTEQPSDYFAVSGATQIVSSKLNGVPGEYSLLFTVWQRDGSQQHGVLHGSTIEQVVNDYTEALMLQLFGELPRPHRGTVSALTTTLTHRAMTLLSQGAIQSAIPFLESAVVEHPDEPMQRFLLARSHLQLGNIESALPHIEAGLAALDKSAQQTLRGRLLYLKGVALMASNLPAASHFLSAAQTVAEEQQDWLYHAYTKAMQGQILIKQQRFSEAEPLFAESLRYQQLLNCPLGIIQGHLDYIDFYLAQGHTTKAKAELELAEKIVRERNLEVVKKIIESYKIKLLKT
jgi:DNA-binding winged helix-turn-helix (wHTH) protein/tetratricopeptide (TPR) repeat protein